MGWLIPYAIAFLAAVGILSERRRAPIRTRVFYAAAVLGVPPALMTGVAGLVESRYGEAAFVAVVLLAFVVAPLALAWHFLRRHPHPGPPDPGLRGAGVRFLPRDESEASVIYCSDPENVPFPTCRAKSAFSHGIVLEYRFALEYLPDWREIDRELGELVMQFRGQDSP